MPFFIIALFVGLVLLREYWLFAALPSSADRAAARGDRDSARKTLESVLRHPSLFGNRYRAHSHHRLSWIYLNDRRTREAVEQCRLALAGRMPPAIESLFRMRLADCLEADGDLNGAAVEKDRANRLADSGGDNPAQLMALGSALKKQGKYTEAIPVLERALSKLPETLTMPRAHLMVSIALACWEAGRIPDTLKWADMALALNPDLTHKTSALSMSGLALGNMGRLDEAEERHRLAYEASSAAGNADQSARNLSMLGEVQRRRGNLQAAIDTCERAAAMSVSARRHARFCEFETYLTWGRFAEARAKLDEGKQALGFAIPRSEQRILAISSLTLALLEIEEGHTDRAMERLNEIHAQLEHDEKVAVSYNSLRAHVTALLGRMDESMESARRATALAAKIPESRNSLLTYHRNMGCAALAAGDAASATTHWSSYFALRPDPVDIPKAHYYLGCCRQASGDMDDAKKQWQFAVDTGLDTLYVARARERLGM